MNNADMPAMPVIASYFDDGTPNDVQEGLTKRELFAALAMQGYIAAGSAGMPCSEMIAELATNTADALLAELEPKPKATGGGE